MCNPCSRSPGRMDITSDYTSALGTLGKVIVGSAATVLTVQLAVNSFNAHAVPATVSTGASILSTAGTVLAVGAAVTAVAVGGCFLYLVCSFRMR